MSGYLRLYPIPWPVFSTKFYKQDSDGWWNPINKRQRRTRNHIL